MWRYIAFPDISRSIKKAPHEPTTRHHSSTPEADELTSETCIDVHRAVAPSTLRQYYRYFSFFKAFLKHFFQLSWRNASNQHFCAFVTFLYKHNSLSLSYIRTHLSALSYFYQLHYDVNPVFSFALRQLLKAYQKLDRHRKKKTRKPIDKHLLHQLLQATLRNHSNCYDRHAFFTLYSLMYTLALRISEVSDYNTEYSHAIEIDNCQFFRESNKLYITMLSYKHSKDSITYRLHCSRRLTHHYRKFIKMRGNFSGPLFSHVNHKPFTRNYIVKSLQSDLASLSLDTSYYNSHSFRIGKASDLAKEGKSVTQISLIGRWNSSAFQNYIKPDFVDAQ